MSELAKKSCQPCKGGVPPLKGADLKSYADQVADWMVIDEHHLERDFKFKDFMSALAFTNKVGELAESEGHHPALLTEWGRVTVTWWTHKIRGLHRNDFIMAAKTDAIFV